MSTPEAAPEAPSKRKLVQQAVILGGFVALAVLMVALTFSRPSAVASTELANAAAPAAPNRAAPTDLATQAADLLANMQSETATPGADRRGGFTDPSRPVEQMTQSEQQQLLAVLQGLGGPPASAPAGEPAPDYQLAHAEQRREARMAPLQGVIVSPTPTEGAGAVGGAGQGTAGDRLRPGTVLEAALVQTLSSDYPGTPWIGMLTRDAYLADGALALPKGSKVLGTTTEDEGPNAILQGRLALQANSIVRPDGVVIALEARALDAAGIGAVPGPTKRHLLAQTGGVLAYALIGAATLGTASGEPVSSQSDLQASAMVGAANQVTPLANRYLNVKPTVTPAAGTPIRIVLTDGLAVAPYREG